MGRAMRHRRFWVELVLASSLAVGACADTTAAGMTNVPDVGVTSQSLGFSVQASHFSFEETYASPTLGDSLVVGLAVLNYGGGTALVEVMDSSGTALARQIVTQSVAQGQTTIHGRPPYTVHLLFTEFTGTFALGVAAQAP